MYLCVDFDGTIVDHAFPEIGKPAPGAVKWLHRLHRQGAKIILFTVRSNGQYYGDVLNDALRYLKKNKIVLFGINNNPDQLQWSNSPKPFGHFYIDDAAFGCPLIFPKGFNRQCVDWSKVGPAIESRLLSGV